MKNLYKAVLDIGLTNYGFLSKKILKTYALAPLRTRILLTYRCNCVCHFCNAHFPGKEELTLADVDNITKQLPKGSVITFSGGEITLLKDFLPMMKLASRQHKVQIITSGSTLDKNKGMIKELVDYGLWVITFSIDVPNALHDKIRGPQGLLQNIVAAIKEIKEIRKQRKITRPQIHINSVVLKESMAYLPDMVKFAMELGVDAMSFGGLGVNDYDENDLALFKEKFAMAKDVAQRAKFPLLLGADVETAFDALKDHQGSLKEGIPQQNIRMSNFACYAPWSLLLIEPDGMAHICRDGVSNGLANTCPNGMKKYNALPGTLGNIKRTPLKELWNNQNAQKWRQLIIDTKELPLSCLSCCLITKTGK